MIYSRSIPRLLLALSLGATLAGCGGTADRPGAAQQPAARPTVTSQPATSRPAGAAATASPPPAATPTGPAILGFEPQLGGPNTPVSIWGSGYQPNAPVVVRLGFPQPTGEVLASAVADAEGRWQAQLVIPENLPSGEPIANGAMHLVAMNEHNQALASAPFGFVAGQVPRHVPTDAEARDTLRLLLETRRAAGDIRPYLSADRREQLANGRPLEEVAGLKEVALEGFDIREREDRPAGALFIPALLRYPSFSEERVFTLVIEGDAWKIAGSASREELPPLGNGWPGPEWQPAASGDFNGDGEQETVYVNSSTIAPQAGFGDPALDGAARLGGAVLVVQGAGQRSATLLRIDQQGIIAGETPLVSFEPRGGLDGPAAFLVASDPARNQLRLLLLTADGAAHGPALGLRWDAAAGGFRVADPEQ